MKLSEAILLGIGAVKNESKVWLTSVTEEGPCGCAIGTALYAMGMKWSTDGLGNCYNHWPWTRQPYADNKSMTIARAISLRHYQGESRESIAAWIATIEPQEDTPEPTPHTQLQEVQDGHA